MTAGVAGLAVEVGGLGVPDAGPVFLTALAVHVPAGATAVVAGVLAATAVKRPGRHPRAGTVYLCAVAVVFVTAVVMAVLRWRQDWHLLLIATLTAGLAGAGWLVRRLRPRRWVVWHGSVMAGSLVGLFTGFYVDNGPQLPGWDRLPHLAYWLLPAAVGIPLTWRALVRNAAGASGWGVAGRDVEPGGVRVTGPGAGTGCDRWGGSRRMRGRG
jgi:hypothetical protein